MVCAGMARYMFRVVDSYLLGYWLHSQYFRVLTGLCLEEFCEKRAALVLPQAPAVSDSDGHDSSRFIVLLSLVSYRYLVLNNHCIIRVRIARYIFSIMNMCTVHSKHCSQHIYVTSRKSQQSHFWGGIKYNCNDTKSLQALPDSWAFRPCFSITMLFNFDYGIKGFKLI